MVKGVVKTDGITQRVLLWMYLVIVNIYSFILFSSSLTKRKRNSRTDRAGITFEPAWLHMAFTVLGGALGVNVSFLLFYPRFTKGRSKKGGKRGKRPKKSNSEQDNYHFWRVFSLVMLGIQAIAVLLVLGINISELVSMAGGLIGSLLVFKYLVMNDKMAALHAFGVYLLVINVITFFMFVLDKWRAENGVWRIREKKLFLFSFLGGSAGALLAMYVVRHKVLKKSFAVGIRLMLLMQVFLITYILYGSGVIQMLIRRS